MRAGQRPAASHSIRKVGFRRNNHTGNVLQRRCRCGRSIDPAATERVILSSGRAGELRHEAKHSNHQRPQPGGDAQAEAILRQLHVHQLRPAGLRHVRGNKPSRCQIHTRRLFTRSETRARDQIKTAAAGRGDPVESAHEGEIFG